MAGPRKPGMHFEMTGRAEMQQRLVMTPKIKKTLPAHVIEAQQRHLPPLLSEDEDDTEEKL